MKPLVGKEASAQADDAVLPGKGGSPVRELLKEIIAPFDRTESPYYVLRLSNLEPWTSIKGWLDKHLGPGREGGINLRQAWDPFQYWAASDPDFPAEKISFVDCSLDFEGDLAGLRRQLQEQVPEELRQRLRGRIPEESEAEGNSVHLFNAIDATPLLYYPGWRLAIARLLRYVTPGGVVLYPQFSADALLLDGQVADWVRADGNNTSASNTFLRTICWLYLQIEENCNRPWIPEIRLSKPDALRHLLGHLLEYDNEVDQEGEERFPDIHLKPTAVTAEEYFKLHSINAYISPSEQEMVQADLLREQARSLNPARGDGEKDRNVKFGCMWHCIKTPSKGLSHRRINDATVLSLTSERRNLLDTEHHLLPEFTAELDIENDTPREIEDKILRSLRGFVCRTIHHDRFDPENHHLFVASLWIPKRDEDERTFDVSEGRFSDVTGCVFRRKSSNEDDILDQALRNVTYWAHAQATEMSLQTIPQILFDTDRPVIRIRRSPVGAALSTSEGERYDWKCSIEGDSQLDVARADLLNLEATAKVPAEICLTIPDLDATGAGWQKFKERFLTREILAREMQIGGQGRPIDYQLKREIWAAREGSLYSFPWDTARVRRRHEQNPGTDKFNWNNFAKLPRGVAAGHITDELTNVFDQGDGMRGNAWINALLPHREQLDECYKAFEETFIDMLNKLGITAENRQKFTKSSEKIFSALVALTLVFPVTDIDGPDWELVQAPVGAFLHGRNKKFVSAGACVLLKRTRSTQRGLTPDKKLKQNLAEVRSSQLLRRVPTVLLPLSTLLLVNNLREESIQSRLQEERAESARGLLHNLRNLISPALDVPEGTRYIFDKSFGTPQVRMIDFWDTMDWWQESVEGTEAAEVIKDWRKSLLFRLQQLHSSLHQRGASAVWVKRTLDAYYSYLSGGEQGHGPLAEILEGTLSVIWEMWSTPTSWTPEASVQSLYNIPPEEWTKRNEKLLDSRTAAGKSKPWGEQKAAVREWWVKPGFIKIMWASSIDESLHISSPAIAFHIFYELIWNGLKHLATQKFIIEPDSPEVAGIDLGLTYREDSKEASFIYSQTCLDRNIDDIVDILNGKFSKDKHVFRGLMGIPNMAHRCGWSLTAERIGSQLVVRLGFPIRD